MSNLKGIIFSVEDTLIQKGITDAETFHEITKLINFCRTINIEFVVFTNRRWVLKDSNKLLKDILFEQWGEFEYICAEDDTSIPKKPKKSATSYVLNKMNWGANEVIYVGSSDNDMRTAVNGNLLFLKAAWYADNTDYGFEFNSPKNIARFIDTFCLREHLWCHQIIDDSFAFYALAPFSTMKEEYTLYSEDARSAAKYGQGHPEFWTGALVSSLYFSGIHNKIDYISVYPGHSKGSGNPVIDDSMRVFGNCFRKKYIPDLIVRHTTAMQSRTARQKKIPLNHLNQLNTIHVNPNPSKSETSRYINSPLKRGKTVLLIDDICTNGYSLDAAKSYIEKTGATVILVSWLKTINSNIHSINPSIESDFDPYAPNNFSDIPKTKTYNYHEHFTDHLAPTELTEHFKNYLEWDWPS